MPCIRSISGLRATLDGSLTHELILSHVRTFARLYPGPVVVGRDGRPSGEWIEKLVTVALVDEGCDVRLVGLAPTPTVQFATEKSDAAGGISITASHNPDNWNGLKFLGPDGMFLGPDEARTLFEDAVMPLAHEESSKEQKGDIEDASGWIEKHVDAVLSLPFIDTSAVRDRRFNVVVDAVNASGSYVVPELLDRLGCSVDAMNCDGSGDFSHPPEPLPQNLSDLAERVAESDADLGIAVDPDADRLVLIDERGIPIGEEYSITLAANEILERQKEAGEENRVVVVNLSTTRAIDDVAEKHGATVRRTPVGEINVVLGMKESGAKIGGEGSGGIIAADLHYGRDSLAGIAIVLSSLARRDVSLSHLRGSLPDYTIVKTKIPLGEHFPAGDLATRLVDDRETYRAVDTSDGVRIDFESSWVHVRTSNTEPVARVIAEAPTLAEAEKLVVTYRARLESMVDD